MAQKSRVKVEYHRSRTLTKIVVLAAIVLSIAALVTVNLAIRDARSQTEALRAEAAQLEQENSRLERDMAELGTVQGIIRVAQEKLGLVEPDSIIFQPEE